MEDWSDRDLLEKFGISGDQGAFSNFVNRHLKLVYSVALRGVSGDRQLAEDVAQQVFADAAQKATKLATRQSVIGWLFTATRYAASKVVRGRIRQAQREEIAAKMNEIERSDSSSEIGPELLPLIEGAIDKLSDTDRDAIIYRYYEQLDYLTIGSKLGLSPAAVRMRVDRALSKLRASLSRKDITSTGAALATTLGSHALTVAPSGLSAAITTTAVSTAMSAPSAFVACVVGAKGSIAATVAVVSIGFIIQLNLPVDESLSGGMNGRLSGETMVSDSAAESIKRDQRSERGESDGSRDSLDAGTGADPVELAYAALDRDAALLEKRLSEVVSQAHEIEPKSRAASEPVALSELDVMPKPASVVEPVYPTSFFGSKIPGEVYVKFVIAEDGSTGDFELLSATHPVFAANVLYALARSQFEPGKIANQAVATKVRQKMQFEPNANKRPKYEDWF